MLDVLVRILEKFSHWLQRVMESYLMNLESRNSRENSTTFFFSKPCTNINREQLDDFIQTTEDLDDHESNTHEKLNLALKDMEINVSEVSKAVNALSPKASP